MTDYRDSGYFPTEDAAMTYEEQEKRFKKLNKHLFARDEAARAMLAALEAIAKAATVDQYGLPEDANPLRDLMGVYHAPHGGRHTYDQIAFVAGACAAAAKAAGIEP